MASSLLVFFFFSAFAPKYLICALFSELAILTKKLNQIRLESNRDKKKIAKVVESNNKFFLK